MSRARYFDDKPYDCPTCLRTFKNRETAMSHARAEHADDYNTADFPTDEVDHVASRQKIYDCLTCVNLRTHANPVLAIHKWQCGSTGLSVGPRVLNCTNFKRAKIGAAPPPPAVTEPVL